MPINFGSTGIGEIYYGNTPIKEVYSGSDLVWSAVKPSYGFLVGGQTSPEAWQVAPYGTWGLGTSLSPHPDYPSTVTASGVHVKSGTYSVELWSSTLGSGTGVRGIRATLDGAPIPGLSVQKAYSGEGLDVRVSGVAELSSGWLSMQGYTASNTSYLYSGSPARAGLTAVPYTPGSWPQTGTWSGNTTSTTTTFASFTVTEAGIYDLEWAVTWGGTGSVYGEAVYTINGSGAVFGISVITGPGTSTATGSSVALAAGDEVAFLAYSSYGTRPATGSWTVNKVG